MSRNNGTPTRRTPKVEESHGRTGVHPGTEPVTGTTVIAEDITISGDLLGAGEVLIGGTFIGRIKLDGTVTVAKTGVVKGPVIADSVCVAGAVEGNLATKGRLRLEAGGRITGDVVAGSLIIEAGAYFNGQSRMRNSAPAKKDTTAAH